MVGGQLRTIGLVLAAAVVIGSGVWLTRSGRPYGTGLTNVHKLVDLAAVVVIALGVYQVNRAAQLPTMTWMLIATAALLIVATFASGGVVTAMHAPPAWVVWLHRVVSWIAVALAALTVYAVGSG